jgi:hypothetical protein
MAQSTHPRGGDVAVCRGDSLKCGMVGVVCGKLFCAAWATDN